MDLEEAKEQIDLLFNPDPSDFGGPPEFPHPRLTDRHKLDFTYMESSAWEGSSGHRYTRFAGAPDHALDTLTRNSDMPVRLMHSALQLFADSIISYFEAENREGDVRYYPAIILTFWSGFETFVKYASELLLLTVLNIPDPVRHFLKETEEVVEQNGSIRVRTRYQPVLNRYAVLIGYGYGLKIDKGNSFWQNLEKARKLRDYYTHLNMNVPRAITTEDVSSFIEFTLLGLIWPSALLQRTLLIGQYQIYMLWVELQEFAKSYRERPFFLDWHLKEAHLFHCNFENVDPDRYPSVRDERYHEALRRAERDK
jgi:hypothetical protein